MNKNNNGVDNFLGETASNKWNAMFSLTSESIKSYKESYTLHARIGIRVLQLLGVLELHFLDKEKKIKVKCDCNN